MGSPARAALTALVGGFVEVPLSVVQLLVRVTFVFAVEPEVAVTVTVIAAGQPVSGPTPETSTGVVRWVVVPSPS